MTQLMKKIQGLQALHGATLGVKNGGEVASGATIWPSV